MFGSKLRSWMETHIVRPRKKTNKHKQSQSEASIVITGHGHTKKAGTLPQCSNLKSTTSPVLNSSSGSHSIASPVRRREVSPIQCHTPSRYGWQSPDHETITSPKSDHLLNAPQHRYQRQLTTPTPPLPPTPQPAPPLSGSSSADKSPLRVNCSSSSISSLSWSTGSKEPSKQLSYQAPAEEEVEYEEVGTLLLRPKPPLKDYQRPRSENINSLQLIYDVESESRAQHVHYGRLLPSKLAAVHLGASDECLPMANPGQQLRLRAPRPLPRANNFLPGPRPHTLSSPESAYSTGYSTDGNSPCAVSSNPPAPEYYINMRTGTHYFPSRATNSYKFGLNRIEEMSPMEPLPPKGSFANSLEPQPSPLTLYESPSPRQRSRIRTNPWYNTAEHAQLRLELDAASSSSTNSSQFKCHQELRPATTTTNALGTPKKLAVSVGVDSECSSSSTEVENIHAAHTVKRRQIQSQSQSTSQQQQHQESFLVLSDDEATLNEMIGKFDESYVYEKETDILSDSDPTDCASELDTGQDAGDECDTDELLDIDFIDTSSMNEVLLERHELHRNLGSCHYYPQPSPGILRRASTRSSRRKNASELPQPENGSGSGQLLRRRKRFLKTRKKNCEQRERGRERERSALCSSLQEPRGSRSVGGTPVCLRRQLLGCKERIYKTSPLSNRSNSLIFGNITERHFMTIAESEKALLKADLEADIKYKQLIMEAESLLESLKNSLQSIPRDTPVSSPRRINPLANKRVEMLKHSEVEAKKQVPPTPPLENELAAAINKRIELLKFETASPPNSPKLGRCSPRKTHLTNFMNQNTPPEMPSRKHSMPTPAPLSPKLQLNGRYLGSPRHMHRTAALFLLHAEEEEECIAVEQQFSEDVTNHNYLKPEQLHNNLDYNNRNVLGTAQVPTMPQAQDNFYCPHSEPLKRKVYKGSSSFERIKKTFDFQLDMNERAKSPGLSNKRQQSKLRASVSAKSSMQDVTTLDTHEANSNKQQLIVSTIVQLKRSLEHQSYELSGLTEE
ncbi:uncharacterized protein LOC108595188 isoform X2 [Drosophila busckii]|uniref:uncharacterized protein LOC108595188 isoform X2 n=1 Tax=Drosophila busckii TaxID=30019 RepID=UPI00083F046C|nr:uncharacterized protein LOC108595188 isoform X2 [Drosophila busckii]